MAKFKLKLQSSRRIVAPDFCPYKIIETDGISVDPSLCPLCKSCEFIPETIVNEDIIDKQKFINYIMNDYKLAANLSGQNQYLIKNGRIPLAILMSGEIFQKMILNIYFDIDIRQKVYTYFMLHEDPICHMMGCPVYLSSKLTRSEMQVVGEIEWK